MRNEMRNKKYNELAAIFNAAQDKKDISIIELMLTNRELRRKNVGLIAVGYQLSDILKFSGHERFTSDHYKDKVILWAEIKSKAQIEAFNKMVWSFGFKHTNTQQPEGTNTVSISYDLDGFGVEIHYLFGEDSDCKLVKIGEKTVDVMERQCSDEDDNLPLKADELVVDDAEPAVHIIPPDERTDPEITDDNDERTDPEITDDNRETEPLKEVT